MEEKDDELQTNFGVTRCSIWGLALVGTRDGGHRERRAHWGRLGRPGETMSPSWSAQHHQQFLLIVQLAAGKH